MSKKKLIKRTNLQKLAKVQVGQQPQKNNTLIFGGILIATSSIGLLIFVFSNKIFHLS